jgi:septation ring formation regulator EzrA
MELCGGAEVVDPDKDLRLAMRSMATAMENMVEYFNKSERKRRKMKHEIRELQMETDDIDRALDIRDDANLAGAGRVVDTIRSTKARIRSLETYSDNNEVAYRIIREHIDDIEEKAKRIDAKAHQVEERVYQYKADNAVVVGGISDHTQHLAAEVRLIKEYISTNENRMLRLEMSSRQPRHH